jgi:hypothetical protein
MINVHDKYERLWQEVAVYCPNICLENWGEEAIIEVADRVVKEETLASRIRNIRWIKLSGSRYKGSVHLHT